MLRLQLFGDVGSPDLKRRTTLPIFQISGKVPESNDMLMIFVKLGAIAEALFRSAKFSNLALIRSRPMALLYVQHVLLDKFLLGLWNHLADNHNYTML